MRPRRVNLGLLAVTVIAAGIGYVVGFGVSNSGRGEFLT